jgi:hypothetical protein
MKPAILPMIPKLLLVSTLAAVVGTAVSTAWNHGTVHAAWQRLADGPSTADTAVVWATDLRPRPVVQLQPTPAAPVPVAVQVVRPAPVPARVNTELLVAGIAHPTIAGPVALPSGTRLQVRLTPTRNGQIELHAISPAGDHAGAPLWTAAATAGSTVQSPPLRLQGQRGMETLRVVLRSPNGAVVSRDDVHLWHH